MSELRWAMYMSADVEYEIQRNNQFSLIVTGLGDEITLAVDSTTLPDLNISPIELSHGNTKVKVAGAVAIPEISVMVKDFILPDVEGILYDWYNEVYEHESGKVGWAQHYKKNGLLYLFSPDGSVARSWSLLGMWPSTISWGDFNYDSSDKRQITMTLQVDRHHRNAKTGVPGTQGTTIASTLEGQDT